MSGTWLCYESTSIFSLLGNIPSIVTNTATRNLGEATGSLNFITGVHLTFAGTLFELQGPISKWKLAFLEVGEC